MRINKHNTAKAIIYALIFIFFMILETNMLNGVKVFGAKPNLIISLVIAAAVIENVHYAAVLGMIAGFVIDSSVGSPFFFSGIYYFFAAYIASLMAKQYFSKSLFTMIILILPVCAAREIFNMIFLMGTWGNFNMGGALLGYALPSFLYTVMLAPLVYLLVRFTAGRIEG